MTYPGNRLRYNMGSWHLERHSKNVHRIRIDGEASRDWEQWILLTGDRHFDSPYSRRDLQRKHLEEARERGAPVIDIGDFFDLMQGKHDPRASKKTQAAALAWYLPKGRKQSRSAASTRRSLAPQYLQLKLVQWRANRER